MSALEELLEPRAVASEMTEVSAIQVTCPLWTSRCDSKIGTRIFTTTSMAVFINEQFIPDDQGMPQPANS